MSSNVLASELIRNLETGLTPDVASVIEPGAPPPDPLSAPVDLNAFAAPPASPRPPRVAAVRNWEGAAAQRDNTLNAPSLRKLGSLAKLFPGAEKVRVRRQMADGDMGPIGEWPMRTIHASGDMESFLMTHVRPKWGGGRYQISVFDATGRDINAGEVTLPEPIGGDMTAAPANDNVLLKLVDQLREKNNMQQAPAPDPIELMHRTNKLLTDLKGKDSSSELMIAMMQISAQQQQQSQQMMMQLLGRQPDPELAALKAELAALKAAPPPMPMPLPAGPEVSPLMEKILMMVAPVLIERVLKPELSTKDILELARPQTPPKSDLDAMKEAVSFLQSVQGSQKQVSLVDELEKFRMIKEVASNVIGGDSGAAPQASFFDALGALFSNKMFGDSLGKMMGATIEQRRAAAPQLPAQAQTPPQPQVQPQVQRPAPAQPQPAAAAQQQAAQARVQFPPNMRQLCDAMASAADDQTRIQYATETLYTLRSIPVWTPFVDGLLDNAIHNRPEPALNGLRGWLRMLIDKGLLEEQAALRVIKSFTEHWDSFHTVVRKLVGLEPLPAPVADPAVPANAAPAPEPAPAAPAADAVPAAEGTSEADGEDEGEDEDDDEDE